MPGMQPYTALNTSFVTAGKVEVIGLFTNQSKEVLCLIDPNSIADYQGTKIDSLTAKVYTALLSMGVVITPAGFFDGQKPRNR